ncbi:putative Organic solute transporter Ostalpha-domain-containing protein [Seiridium unicorne]|uniref:Organic solute transporter Ostalpha-domain-containing protein n=1 Tax=Seiridium unicorne TaxID=138068 RepID=A0ABR2V771_9PEZI
MNLTCNSTLEEMRIGSETKIAGPFTFHQLALIIAGGCAAIAILTSFYLMWRHATNYTKPREQKHIIRILFMVPIYSASAFLCIWYYWHAVYFQVISDCYEAFAISSFFALMCHYMAPDLHEQKEYFRHMHPVKPWVWPVTWAKKCCGGERGPWRTPKSGLTWFNIIWIGIYHYCFIRVAMTITAVVTQYFDRYCESSNNPVFAHIWVLVIESIAVTIAMYCVIQFYIQLKGPLAEHRPFLKVLAIKLVIFLSFWQSSAISVGTSTLHLVEASDALAYPDLKVGIPSLLLCVEMALFAILHLWAFPYSPYVPGAKQTFYPVADPSLGLPARENEHDAPQGGFMGVKAFVDALNVWDVVKAFGRGIRWLFVGVKKRHNDPSYTKNDNRNSLDTSYPLKPFALNPGAKSTDHLPIATQFRQSTFYDKDGMLVDSGRPNRPSRRNDESAGLIHNAQDISVSPPRREPSPYLEEPLENPRRDGGAASPYHDPNRGEYYQGPPTPAPHTAHGPYQAYSEAETDNTNMGYSASVGVGSSHGSRRQNPRNSTQVKFGNALWGDRSQPGEQR